MDDSQDVSQPWVATATKGYRQELKLDTPSPGRHTVLLRNGLQYVFKSGDDANAMRTPGQTARLEMIRGPRNSALYAEYDTEDRLTTIKRCPVGDCNGLIFEYTDSNHSHLLTGVRDWTGRQWRYEYDDKGRLNAVTNAEGQKTSYEYQGDTFLLSKKTLPADHDGDGSGGDVYIVHDYYPDGKSLSNTNSLNHSEWFDYDPLHRKGMMWNRRGLYKEFVYDQKGSLVKVTQQDGTIETYKNSDEGQRYSSINGAGYLTERSYRANGDLFTFGGDNTSDNFGRVSMVRDDLDSTATPSRSYFEYGPFDQLKSVRDKKGHIREALFFDTDNPDLAGLPSAIGARVDGVLQPTISYSYDGQSRVKTYTRHRDDNLANSSVATWSYENAESLNPSRIALTGSGKTVIRDFTHDALGRKTTETLRRDTASIGTPAGALTTAFVYDNLDRPIRITDPLNNIRDTEYDANGNIKKIITTPHGEEARTIEWFYDGADRPYRMKDEAGKITSYEHDAVGNVIRIEHPDGTTVRYEYDAMNRRTATVDGSGRRWERGYNGAGQLAWTRDPNGEGMRVTARDPVGRPIEIVRTRGTGDGSESTFDKTTYEYDLNGNTSRVTDAENHATVMTHDHLDRLDTLTRANGIVIDHDHDRQGNLTDLTVAKGTDLARTTHHEHDSLGRLVRIDYPSGPSEYFEYDEADNLITHIDRNGETTHHAYDALNRLTLTRYLADGTGEVRTYQADGNLQSIAGVVYDGDEISDTIVQYTYTYDDVFKDKVKSKTDSRTGRTLSWTYDEGGRIRTRTGYDGDITSYQYDGSGRLAGISNPEHLDVTYQYDAGGRLLRRILSNGVRSEYQYNDDGTLKTVRNRLSDGTLAHSQEMTAHDRAGNIKTIVEDGVTTSYEYDAAYQLTAAVSSNPSETRHYTDPNGLGNRQTDTVDGRTRFFEYDINNRLKKIRQDSETGPLLFEFEYDANGNRTVKRNGSGLLLERYEYDQKNRMTRLSKAGGLEWTFKYDPFDQRIEKAGPLGRRLYHLEGEHLESVYDGNGNTLARYFRGVVIDEIVHGYEYRKVRGGPWKSRRFEQPGKPSKGKTDPKNWNAKGDGWNKKWFEKPGRPFKEKTDPKILKLAKLLEPKVSPETYNLKEGTRHRVSLTFLHNHQSSVSDWQTPGSRVRIFSAMLSQGIHLDLEGRHGQVWKYWAPFDRDWPAVAGTCAGL